MRDFEPRLMKLDASLKALIYHGFMFVQVFLIVYLKYFYDLTINVIELF